VIADKCMCKRLDHHGLVQEGYRSTWERVLFGQHRLIDFLRSPKKADGLDGRLDRLTCFVLLIMQGVGLGLVETIPTVFPDHGLPCHGVLEFAVYAWTVRSTQGSICLLLLRRIEDAYVDRSGGIRMRIGEIVLFIRR
jgi:hypothetical protein